MSAARSSRLLVIAAALLFSTGGTAIKLSTLSGWQISAFRSLLAAAVLAALQPAWLRACLRPQVWGVGVAYAATLTLYVIANTLTTAANAIFLQQTAPLYVLLLAPRLLGEPTRRSDLGFAVLLALGLVLFFVGSEDRFATAPDPTTGNWLGVISGATYAAALIGLRWLVQSQPSDAAAGGAVVAGNLLVFATGAAFAFPVASVGVTDAAVVVYLGVFQVALAYLLMVRGVAGTPAVQVSLLILLEPVCNALLAWAVHGERPGAWSGAGCAIILAAVTGQVLWEGTRAETSGEPS